MKSNPDTILLYDDQCGFCSQWIDFVVQRQRNRSLRCYGLSSELAREILKSYGLDALEIDSVVYIADGRAWTHSTAVVRILRKLRFPWCLLGVLGCIPKGLRDWGYRWVAARRQRFNRCSLN